MRIHWNRAALVAAALLAIVPIAWRYWPAEKLAASGLPIVDVTVPSLTSLESEGRSAFIIYCDACHGENAAGRDGIGPPLVHILYQPGHHGDAAFLLATRNGVRQHHWDFGDMPPVEGIRDTEIAAIAAYVRALQGANDIR